MRLTTRNPVAAISVGLLLAATAASGPLPPARAGEPATPAGITWPSDRALPTFAKAEHLDVADIGPQPPDAKALFATLEGLVNRRRPRIYLLGRPGEGKTTWLESLGVPYSTLDDPWQLITRYRAEIKGVVVTDPKVPASINVATTLAGLEGDVVASPGIAGRLSSEFHLPITADLRGRFSDDLAAYTWEVENLWPRTTHRMLVGIGPGEAAGLRDYPVATRALAIWLRVGVSEERALWERILRDMPPNSPYVGWFDIKDKASGELPGVWFLSEHGVYDIAGDLFWNMTVFSGVPAPSLAAPQPSAEQPRLGSKIYVTFVQSDGDNPQYLQHRMRIAWGDPKRGRVPLNWTVNPLLADCAPALLAYYRKTSTTNDYFVAGPSGAGYAFVSQFPAEAFRAFADQTGRYLARTGIRIVEVHNNVRGVATPIPPDKAAIFAAGARPLGVLTFARGLPADATVFGSALLAANQLFVHDASDAQRKIAQATSDWNGRTPRFLAVYFDAWHMGPSDAVAIAGSLDGRYDVVRGDQFFELARAANGTPPQ
jgi:hypothetical protein